MYVILKMVVQNLVLYVNLKTVVQNLGYVRESKNVGTKLRLCM